MARKRQQDPLASTAPQQIVAPKASAVNLSFGARPPKSVESIAFDFRSLSQSLDTLSRRASKDREKKYERTAEEARQVFIKAQLEGADSENELFERWQEFASNNGLTEAATVHGQREIARSNGRGKAAHLIGQVRIKVEQALQGEDEVPENSETFWKEALEEAGIDLKTLDFYQMEGLGPLVQQAKLKFNEALEQEDYMRDTAILQEAAASRVIGYFNGEELSVEGLSEVVGGLSTSENGAIFPVNRKPALMSALKQMQVDLTGDTEAFLKIMDVADELDFGGTKFSDDQSGPELANGQKGEPYALQLARMRRSAVAAADNEAVQWQTKSDAKVNKAIGTTPEYWQSIDAADDGPLTPTEIGELHAEISGFLSNAGLTDAQLAQAMAKWSQSIRTAQTHALSDTAAQRRERVSVEKEAVSALATALGRGEVTPAEIFDMIDVSGAEEVYGTAGVMALRTEARAAADFTSFATHPTTARVADILTDDAGLTGLTSSELATLSDTSAQTSAEIQSAFQDMMRNSATLPPALLLVEVENFLKSPLVTDAVEARREAVDEARIKADNRELELTKLVGVLNTTALREIAGDESLPRELKLRAEEAIIQADRRSVIQTWGQFNSFMRELGSLLDVENAAATKDDDIGSLEAILDRQNADAATRFSKIARKHFVSGLENNTRPITVVEQEALEFALKSMEKEASQESQRALNAQRLGGPKLLEATNRNDLEASNREARVTAARGKNKRSFDTLFPDSPITGDKRANKRNIGSISDDLLDAAEAVYKMEPGAEGWAEVQSTLQIQSRKAANAILTAKESGELSDEDAQSLFNIGQITPGFYSLDDIAETGQISHRTEPNMALIVKIRAEQEANTRLFAVTEARRKALIAKNDSSIGGRKTRVQRFVDREVFEQLQEEHRRFLKKNGAISTRLRAALKTAREFSSDKVHATTSSLEATTDSNLNALTVPWKRSFEELMKYKNARPENWEKFLAAIGIVDEAQFLDEQRNLYK